jgi:hypothetical protein
VKEGT